MHGLGNGKYIYSVTSYTIKSVCTETCCGCYNELYEKPATKEYQEWENKTLKNKGNCCKNPIVNKHHNIAI
jgi:hypothetical protein